MNGVLRLFFFVANLFGFNLVFNWLNSEKIRVLMYHGISKGILPDDRWTILSEEDFKWQMRFVKRRYRVSASSLLLESDSSKPNTYRNCVVLTFDDGLRNTYDFAWPILRDLGLTAICFVIPGLSVQGEHIWADEVYEMFLSTNEKAIDLGTFGLGCVHLDETGLDRSRSAESVIEKLKSFHSDQRVDVIERLREILHSREGKTSGSYNALMTIEQIRELSESSEFEIGSHSLSHPIMSTMSPAEQDKEIRRSLEVLEKHNVKTVPVFAYPNGRPQDYNQATLDALKRYGIKAAVTTIDGLSSDQDSVFEIKRICIGASTGRSEFRARLSGLYYFLRGLKT